MNSESSSAENTTFSEQQVLPAGEYSAKEIFSRVGGEVKSDHHYFVENPPERVKLSDEQLRALESREPFFVAVNITKNQDGSQHFESKPNSGVVPYAFEESGLGRKIERFASAEDLTKGDSGILALSAISAGTPEQQAALYKTLSQVVLDVHENNPELLRQWLDSQINTADPINSSVQIFYLHQIGRGQESGDFNEILLPMNPTLDTRMAESMWAPRMAELREALYNDKLQPHHLRWIEYLSHSVDIPEAFEHIKAVQGIETNPTGNQQATQTNQPEKPQLDIESPASKDETLHTGELGEDIKEIDRLVDIVREKMKTQGIDRQTITFNDGQRLEIDTSRQLGLVFTDRYRDDYEALAISSGGGYPVAEPQDIKAKFTLTSRLNNISLYYLGKFPDGGNRVGPDLRLANKSSSPMAYASISGRLYRLAETFSDEQPLVVKPTKLILSGLRYLESQK